METTIRPPRQFPCSVVWVPIPLVTWLLPFVGHLGVALVDGTILDFLGPYTVQLGEFGFGHPARYYRLDPALSAAFPGRGDVRDWWDAELRHSAAFFRTLFYNFCGTNCHSFVAFFLNQINYRNLMNWNTLSLATLLFFRGSYVDCTAFLKTWLPFVALWAAGIFFWGWFFVACGLGLAVLVVLYFAVYEFLLKAQLRLLHEFRAFERPERHGTAHPDEIL